MENKILEEIKKYTMVGTQLSKLILIELQQIRRCLENDKY